MHWASKAFVFLCWIYVCHAQYGYHPPSAEGIQSDVQAPAYVPPYMKNQKFTKTGYSNSKTYTGTKTYSGRKTSFSGTKTGYGGTKTAYSGTKTGGGGTKSAYGEKQTWHSESNAAPTYQEFSKNANQPFVAKCEPECKNNGICVDTNTCRCPPNFKGRFCEIVSKPCLSYPPLPMNSARRCSPDFCTITCIEGHKFAGLGTTVANMKCSVDGQWQPTIPLLAAIPDCEPQCSPPCLNGGVCLAIDTCQCPTEFRGPQCQYSSSACDIRKLAFNGGYNCYGDADSFTCQLTCPGGATWSSPPAEVYTCRYDSGQFQPQPIPRCVLPENTIIIPGHRINHTHSSNWTSESHTSNESQQSSGFDQQTGDFDQHTGEFDQQTGGFEQETGGFDTQTGYEHQYPQSGRPVKIVVQDLTPRGGICLSWAGEHYKTFDGKIYSFQSPCQHVLVRERKEHRYTVAVKQRECARKAYCPAEITVYLEDKPYVLSVGEDGAVLFRSTHRLIPIPASLPGIRVSMPSDYVEINLDAEGVTIKWDINHVILVEGTVQIWNNTEGLCGTLNGNAEDDFFTKEGSIADTKSVMASSWQLNKIGDICNDRPSENSACSAVEDKDMKAAQQFCANIFTKEKFKKCSQVMDVTQLLQTCQWDYCACASTEIAEECACATVAVYAKECLRNGVQEMRNWRDAQTCPMKCPEGKVYKACGPDSQPSCAFPKTSAAVDNTTCVEGCFCPEGTLLEGGKCVAKSECPCRLRNKSFKPGSVVKKDCNTCSCQAGEWTCTQAPCGARCSAIGDPHYMTFDGLRYDFMGHCTYDLMRADNVTIEVENVACSGAITEAMNLTPYKGDGKPSCTKSINLKYGDVTVHMKQGGYILVDGQEVSSLPVLYRGVRIRTASSLFVIVQLPNKVDLWWDGNTRVFVDVPPEFHGKTKGLCGTFNLNQKDDFLTPEGDIEQSSHAFANKWKTREFCEDVSLQEPEHPCKANVENKEAAEKYCSKLKSKLFEPCHWYVDVEPYYQACVYDMCACAGDAARCLCPVLGDYAMLCAKSGVSIQWRYNVKECELSCAGGQEYTVCADSCQRTCTDVAATPGQCKPCCVEGCACPPGQVLDENNVCVPTGRCPCYHNGLKFNAGYKEVRPGRRERELCTCIGARWDCVPATDNDIQNYPPAEDLKSNCSASQHMEFTTCEVAEPLTCKNMHLPPSTTTAECRPGCQCRAGYVLDSASRSCVLAAQCPCHHGGRSYPDAHTMQEECNTCECKNGNWSCTANKCGGVCSAWGDSHVTTFDGTEYDFEGVCTYLLAKGALDGKDGFDVEIQNVPCGTTGATCSKSITLKVGTGNDEEIVSLTKNVPIPDLSKLKRIKLRIAGAYVFLDVPSLGMSLQWDRGMRVYVKVDAMWQGRLKGLCGNYNDDRRDDFQTPGGGIPESSALLFVDSWKLKTTCPKAQPLRDHCKQLPQRKDFAVSSCGALKQYPFTLCHSEVAVGALVERCERDACACDAGGDCQCVCTALAAYAQLCAARGVSFKWRTREICPMQCDEECSNYDDCLSPCPLETCDNTIDYAEIKTICEKDTCVEGCKPKKSCPDGQVYTNSSFTECVPRPKCRRVCTTLPDGKEVLEGEIMEEDACHTCRCSKGHSVCTGQPCSTALPIITEPPTERPHDEPLKCITGWTPWLSRGHPETVIVGAQVKSIDSEGLPKPNELQIGTPMCATTNMTQIECRTTVNKQTPKETGLNVECSLERGLYCEEIGNVCPDFEIRVFCQCEEPTTTPEPERPREEPETFQCLNSDHPNYPHPTDCSMFYECTPEVGTSGKKHAVLKNCMEGLMYNPETMVCDWPDSVVKVRPECAPSTEPVLTTTHLPPAVTTPSRCPPGHSYSECAHACNQTCHHYRHTLLDRGECTGFKKCVEGCVDKQCKPGLLWRDENTCVEPKHCTCYFNGTVVKPGGTVTDGCVKCQCLDNNMHCDTSDCTSPSPVPEPREPAATPRAERTEPPTTPGTTVILVKSSETPPPECSPDNYINLLWERDEPLPDAAFTASSVISPLFAPQYAALNGHPVDISAGSWTPATDNDQQYIQVTLPHKQPIYGVVLQGSPLFDQYVTSYEVMYGDDGHIFSLVEGVDGKPKIFRGPVDHNNAMKQMFEPPIDAQVIRIRPLTWHDSIAVRFELIGCQEHTTTPLAPTVTTPLPIQCTEPLGLGADLPIENIEVSSNNELREHFKLDGEKGWKPIYSTPGEWIMFDFYSPRNITGVKTKGGPSGWVTSYNILYTSDLSNFNPVVDNTGDYKAFPANFDKDTVVFNEFRPPIHARYFKVLPIKWNDAIEMRVEPIGCFEPYPVTEKVVITTAPTPVQCLLCPGVTSGACDCAAPDARYYDGESCVSRDQCPCLESFMSYSVGSTFRGANCDECVCKLGGITDCKPVKECKCAPDLVPKLSKDTCECLCTPCQNNTRICPTSKVCLELEKWCDGLQDCPDDEKGCKEKEPYIFTAEPTVVTTVAPTQGVTMPAVTTTTLKPIECPVVECPPGYFVRYTSKSSYSRSSDLPPPRPRQSYSRYTKTTYTKNGRSYSKGGYSKGGYSKGGYSKGGLPPNPTQASNLPLPSTPAQTNVTKECAQFKCIPNLPPPFRPGSTPAPAVCSPPLCPPNYALQLDNVPLEPNQCPQYICVPPPERLDFCNMTGRTFNTFDGAEYKYDVCYHVLARDARLNAWSVLVRKMCTVDGCENQLIVQQDDEVILVKPNLMIQYNQYEYTVEQTSKICFQKNSFDVNKIGNGLSISSRRYDFGVLYSTDGNVKVGVSSKYKGSVDGLCGFYDGSLTNERRKPDGSLATTITEFGSSWAKPGLRADACEAKVIPPEKQRKIWDMCDVITKEPISKCGKVLNLDKWRSICLEKICECSDLVINGTKRTEEECRCLFLDALVAQCLAADSHIDLSGWRMQMDCPADCPPPLVHYECYRRRCEPTCSELGSSRPCPAEDGQCFPGCYCPDGKLRRGDTCVSPTECRDCTCSGVGTPAKYVSFEGDDLPFLGNCTYLASRDRNDTGEHIYEVYATNGPCEDNSNSVCTKSVHLIYGKNVVHVTKDDVTKKLITTVNNEAIYKYTLDKDWLTVSQINGQDVTLLLNDAHVEIKVLQSKMEFSVRVPSYVYANKTEGLCGVCAGYQEKLVTSNGTVTEDFNEYGKSWQATPLTLEQLAIPPQEQCGEIPPPPPCVPPPPEHNPCYNLLNADKFGACHALLDPEQYVTSCQEELCARNSTDVCAVLERYAAECRRLFVCLQWRDDTLCPMTCPSPLVYDNCMACEGSCENYARLQYDPQSCQQPFAEGCFCPKGTVRVNNTCIEPNKCFPCDANSEHYAGDEWQEDACTKCTCTMSMKENRTSVSCTKESCVDLVCSSQEDRVTLPARPGQCCKEYRCVPKPQENCEEAKKMECGFGQILKQKTTPNGCKQYACECKPPSECEHIPTESEVDIMEPGMERVIDDSGCCPRVLLLCKPEACPAAPACALYHKLISTNVTGKCCPEYKCEPPKDKCIASLEWEAAPKGGEKARDKTQVMLKDLGSVWLDGPCRSCWCESSPGGPVARCSSTECPLISSSEQFVVEPRPVPFACCPRPVSVACRDADTIYRVGENWTSTFDVCESYQCVELESGKLEKVTTVEKCNKECDVGWEYLPAAAGSGKCCGRCRPVACVCEGVQHAIGENWASPDLCTHYSCVEANGTLQVQSTNETCAGASEAARRQFVLKEEAVPGQCCHSHEPVACRVANEIYQEGQIWQTADPCRNVTCARDDSGTLAHRELVETCSRVCPRGQKYQEPPQGQCCGHCADDKCVVANELKDAGETWQSIDNCTTYTCERDGEQLMVTSSRQTCPDVSHCAPELLLSAGCCQTCNEKPSDLSTCVPTPLGIESVGVIRVQLHGRGLCVNTHELKEFKECRGTCDSGTIYNNQTGSHDSKCECCQAVSYEPVTVALRCVDGSLQQHRVASPARCACRQCGGGSSLPWQEHTAAPNAQIVEDEIPEIYQRFGSTQQPRKH